MLLSVYQYYYLNVVCLMAYGLCLMSYYEAVLGLVWVLLIVRSKNENNKSLLSIRLDSAEEQT